MVMGMKKDMRILYYDEDIIVAEEGEETVIFYHTADVIMVSGI
jgi:hypothetical protein